MAKFDMIFNKTRLRHSLITFSDHLEIAVKYLRVAADRLEREKVLTLSICENQNWRNVRPCFVLSTGRTGTLLLTKLLSSSHDAFAIHQPKPELIRASKRAYEEIESAPNIFIETFKSAREELVLRAAIREKVYIETNNRVTFFAPIIQDVFPKAVFIHLVRHPGDFVRSGIRRGWYSGKHDHDIGRIIPKERKMKNKWDELTLIEKIGWLWNETNQFIEDFKRNLSSDKFMFIKAEQLFIDPKITEEIFTFLNLNGFNIKKVKRFLKNPLNVQKKGCFSEYSDWQGKNKKLLRAVAVLAPKYDYIL